MEQHFLQVDFRHSSAECFQGPISFPKRISCTVSPFNILVVWSNSINARARSRSTRRHSSPLSAYGDISMPLPAEPVSEWPSSSLEASCLRLQKPHARLLCAYCNLMPSRPHSAGRPRQAISATTAITSTTVRHLYKPACGLKSVR